jgi:hypothetical protein
MNPFTDLFRQHPLHDPGHAHMDAWESSPLAQLSDHQLIDAVVATITPPKESASSSFILHAPLELLARAALLRHIPTAAKPTARRRIAEIAIRYAQAGSEIATPAITFTDQATALYALRGALAEGDVECADAAVTSLAAFASINEMRAALIDDIVPLLGAAGHAPILFAQLPHVDGAVRGISGLLRAPIRSLAHAPGTRVTWYLTETRAAAQMDTSAALFAALAAPVRFTAPSTSIAPTVLAAETSGEAARVLGDLIGNVSVAAAKRVLLRIAACSMLQDDPSHAPYGWTHCLTLPQALLQNAEASRDHRALIAIAATEVLAMRATEGSIDIDVTRPLEGDAATAFHTPVAERAALVESLATFAGTHRDAHVAKYTLACFQAAAADEPAAPLFLAAAAHLHAWWRTHDASHTG